MSLGGSLAIFIVFCAIRPHHNKIYAPKLKYGDVQKTKPPRLSRNPLKWLWKVGRIKDDELLDGIGLDAVVFLRFMRMFRNLFALFGVLGVAIIIPVNIIFNKKSSWSDNVSQTDTFMLMTPILVSGDGMLPHVIMGYLITLCTLAYLWHNFRVIVRMRRGLFMSPEYQRALFMRSLLVTEIPRRDATNEGLRRLMDSKFKVNRPIQQVAIGKATAGIQKLIEQHSQAVMQLERYMAKYLKKPDPSRRPTTTTLKEDREAFGRKADAIQYWAFRMKTLEKRVYAAREGLEVGGQALTYGLASYQSPEDANVVAKYTKNSRKKGVHTQLAPRPEGIIWRNLVLSHVQRSFKAMWGNIFFAAMMVAWIVPNAFIGCFLSNLSRIGVLWKPFGYFMDGHTVLFAILQGFLSPIVTTLIFLILPVILRRMSAWQGKLTKIQREHDVTRKLYAFFFFNNFFIFTLMSVFWNVVTDIISLINSNTSMSWTEAVDSLQLGMRIANAIVGASSFWVMYMLKTNLSATLEIMQVITLSYNLMRKAFSSPTPREQMMWTAPQPFVYANYYVWMLFYVTIALGFTTIQPLILPIAAVYFAFDYVLKKYSLMYMFVTKVESDGSYWPVVHNSVLFALGFGNLMLLCVVWIQGSWKLAMGVVPMPFFVVGYKIWSAIKMNPRFFYFIPDERERQQMKFTIPVDDVATTALEDKYENPAISKPLMVPVVHAQARDLLPEIFAASAAMPGGQLLAEEDFDMTHGSALDRVDFVEENQMNYGYYRDVVEKAGAYTYPGPQPQVSPSAYKEAHNEPSEYFDDTAYHGYTRSSHDHYHHDKSSSHGTAGDVAGGVASGDIGTADTYSSPYGNPYAARSGAVDSLQSLEPPARPSRRPSATSLYTASGSTLELGAGVAPHHYEAGPDDAYEDDATLLYPQAADRTSPRVPRRSPYRQHY